MYLGEKAVLKKHGANAITINCLGGFYGGHIHAYPCLGFHELNNEGLVGGCECDVPSAAAMVAVGDLTKGRPGYISDPVMDTSERQIIYAHCVASNKVFGPQGPANPFEILTHSEDRQGASVRSLLPPGYMTTTHRDVRDRERKSSSIGPRPSATTPTTGPAGPSSSPSPSAISRNSSRMWDKWGWHRVTFYGDLKEPSGRALAERSAGRSSKKPESPTAGINHNDNEGGFRDHKRTEALRRVTPARFRA